jgi:hypothetical protein
VARYEALKSREPHESSALVESVEQIVYQRVLLLGREAATEEAINNARASAEKYEQGVACLELLLDHDYVTLAEHDRALIRSCTYLSRAPRPSTDTCHRCHQIPATIASRAQLAVNS